VKHKALMVLGLVVAGLAVSLPVRAQMFLPPYEILTIVRSAGLDPLSRPVRQGPAYVLRAVDSYGEEVRVVVSAQRGQILSVRAVVPVAAPYAPPPAYYEYPRPYAPPGYERAPDYYRPDARYDPRPPTAANPRLITAPKPAKPAAKTASTPKAAVAIKKPEALPAAPAETSASAPATPDAVRPAAAEPAKTESAKAPDAPASDIPPVQTLEK
jgi:hypothetical protein